MSEIKLLTKIHKNELVTEEFKPVKGYKGLYEISSFGRVKSLRRNKSKKTMLKKLTLATNGYLCTSFFKEGKTSVKNIHQLVAIAFHNHTPCRFKLVVNHIDFNKLNNHATNLNLITNRENSNKKHLNSTSKYVGVSWSNTLNKWISVIRIDGRDKYLGSYHDEDEAGKAYKDALTKLIKED
jgi:hypothetical protein